MSKYDELVARYPISGNFNKGTLPEIRWVLENIRYSGKVLDVGCYESRLADFLYYYYDETWGIDINEKSCWGDFSDRNYNFACGDIRHYKFNTKFDDITFVSSLEHIGLSAYNNEELDPGGDREALFAARALLADDGYLYVTVPYGDWDAGNSRWGNNWMRVYTDEMLNKLLKGFEVVGRDLVDNNKRICLILR